MGTGKTTVGKILARKLNKEFLEMDEEIEKEEHKKITGIFADSGEAYFRKLEKNMLEKICRRQNLVVSGGGGVVCSPDNLKIMRQSGIVFTLSASVKNIFERTKKENHRPLLNDVNPLEKIKELLAKRRRFYVKADYIIDTNEISCEQAADNIIKILQIPLGYNFEGESGSE